MSTKPHFYPWRKAHKSDWDWVWERKVTKIYESNLKINNLKPHMISQLILMYCCIHESHVYTSLHKLTNANQFKWMFLLWKSCCIHFVLFITSFLFFLSFASISLITLTFVSFRFTHSIFIWFHFFIFSFFFLQAWLFHHHSYPYFQFYWLQLIDFYTYQMDWNTSNTCFPIGFDFWL